MSSTAELSGRCQKPAAQHEPAWLSSMQQCMQHSLTQGCDVSSLQSYRDALDSEDYGTAARLRDEGATGLPGWWVAATMMTPRVTFCASPLALVGMWAMLTPPRIWLKLRWVHAKCLLCKIAECCMCMCCAVVSCVRLCSTALPSYFKLRLLLR